MMRNMNLDTVHRISTLILACCILALIPLSSCGAEPVPDESTKPDITRTDIRTVNYETTLKDGTRLQCFYIERYPESNWCQPLDLTPHN